MKVKTFVGVDSGLIEGAINVFLKTNEIEIKYVCQSSDNYLTKITVFYEEKVAS